MDSSFTLLSTQFPTILFEEQKILAPLTYFKIGGVAEVFCTVKEKAILQKIITFCLQHSVPYTVLGGASNVVVNDEGIKGLVIKNELEQITLVESNTNQGIFYAESGTKMATLVAKTVAQGFTGLEYFLGIPGTLGGATYNNGHYLSHLIGDYITRVEIISEQGELSWLSHDQCEFGYDSSRFHKTKEIIVGVEFTLAKGDAAVSQALIKEATVYRAKTQPLGIPSSGCIFQNTPNTPHLQQLFPQFADQTHVPTGFLVDQAGLKGYTIGGVQVSEKHGAWIINSNNGTAQDVKELIEYIKKTIKEKFDTTIQEEVFYLGNN